LKSNISACHIKLEAWKDAEKAASDALDGLESLDPVDGPVENTRTSRDGKSSARRDEGPKVEEIDDAREEQIEKEKAEEEAKLKLQREKDEEKERVRVKNVQECAARLEKSGHTLAEVQKLRGKVMLRRAKARMEIGGWSCLQGAEEGKSLITPFEVGVD